MIELNQAFYGRDPIHGYRLLASSDTHFNQCIEHLCAAVGSPDGISAITPFYLNYIEHGYRYMIACCVGNPDDSGRKTLFFHAYIGKHQDLLNAHFGICSLIHRDAFLSEFKNGPVLNSRFEEDSFSIPWDKTNITWNGELLAIQSNKPELSLISSILKGKINDVSWASFSFQPLNDFQLYIISQYVAIPRNRKCISSSGSIISLPQESRTSVSTSQNVSKEPKMTNRPTKMLYISLALNVVLFVTSIFLSFNPERNQPTKTGSNDNTIQSTVLPQEDPGLSHIQESNTNLNTNIIEDNQTDISQPQKEENEPPEQHPLIVSQPVDVPTRESLTKELREEFDAEYEESRISLSDYKYVMSKGIVKQLPSDCKDILFKAQQYIIFLNKTLYGETEEN